MQRTLLLLLFACSSDPRPRLPDGAMRDTGVADSGAGTDATIMDAGGDAGAADSAVDSAADGAVESDAAIDAGSDANLDAGPPEVPGPGDLVVVEIQGNPQRANDEEAEYIELQNVSGRPLDLNGVTLAHRNFTGGDPPSAGSDVIDRSIIVAPGARVLLTRSAGGFFGGAEADFVYDGFVFSNGDSDLNRLRVLVPGWDGTEPPAPADLIDEVRLEAGRFDNALRGRAFQLNPSAGAPASELNDDDSNWCHSAETDDLEYRGSNWGTPGETNRCG
ncbi:MAG: lamin tail domain-containing protein [Myxococcota bacterium]